jgi:hypothetical protein
MKTININRGEKIYIGEWQEAFCLVRGQQFGLRGEFHDDEAMMAYRLMDAGATPMQACIDMYGHNGRWSLQKQGTNRALILPSEMH